MSNPPQPPPPPPPHHGHHGHHASNSNPNSASHDGNSSTSQANTLFFASHTSNPSPGSMHRRSSYASVVAGSGAHALGQPLLPPSSTNLPNPFHAFQASNRLPHPASPSSSFPPPSQSMAAAAAAAAASRTNLRHTEGDYQPNYLWPRRATTSSYTATTLPSSSIFNSSTSFSGHDTLSATKPDQNEVFFIPSYLQGSRYADKLHQEHQLRLAAIRDTRSTNSSAPNSLSTSSSSLNLHSHSFSQSHLHNHPHSQKLAPSHRGLTHEIIEHIPRAVYNDSDRTELPQPLPSRWNEEDKNSSLELSAAALEVKLPQLSKRATGEEASSVRANHPMPRMAGIYYFEVTILGHSTRAANHTLVAIGFCGPATSLNRLPGWEPNSYAYHSDDGQLYVTKDAGKPYGSKFNKGDIIGCGINFRTKTAFFTRNGHNIGVAFRDIRQEKLYPVVGLKNQNEQIRVNFGQEPFVFDINAMIQAEKRIVNEEIAKADIENLYPPLSERQLIHKLISQYLSNDGYVETAIAFAKDVRQENEALCNAPGLEQSVVMQDMLDLEPEETGDAVTRQQIRTAILNGDVETGLLLTREHYPSVLSDNDLIYFRLRCRKFIEMIKLSKSAAVSDDSERRRGKKMSQSGHNIDYDGVFGHQMELDDHTGVSLGNTNGSTKATLDDWEGAMDTSEDPAINGNSKPSTTQVSDEDLMAYGTELRTEFMHDLRRDVKRELDSTLALMVYHNPKESALKELLADSGRGKLAEELNSAILLSQGKASSAAIEQLVQQTEVLLQELGDDGGPGAFYNISSDLLGREQ